MENSVRNIQSALDTIAEHWQPHRLTSINDYDVKVVKLDGEFIWHAHPETDELFWVISGRLTIQLRDRRRRTRARRRLRGAEGGRALPEGRRRGHRRAHRAERHREHRRRRRRPDGEPARTTLGSVSTLSELLLAQGRSTERHRMAAPARRRRSAARRPRVRRHRAVGADRRRQLRRRRALASVIRGDPLLPRLRRPGDQAGVARAGHRGVRDRARSSTPPRPTGTRRRPPGCAPCRCCAG